MDMDTKFFEKRGVDMDMDTEFLEKRGVDLDIDTVWNRCPPNSALGYLKCRQINWFKKKTLINAIHVHVCLG